MFGLIAIHMRVRLATTSVRLTLSDGQTVSSPVMNVDRRLGGPAKLYYQVVRGPAPILVTLTEVDGHNRPLQSVALRPMIGCTGQPLKHPRNSAQTITEARTPDGRVVVISSFRTELFNRQYLGLRVAFPAPEAKVIESAALRLMLPLHWNIGRICGREHYLVVYGWLASLDDHVFARSGKEIPCFASCHYSGVRASTWRASLRLSET